MPSNKTVPATIEVDTTATLLAAQEYPSRDGFICQPIDGDIWLGSDNTVTVVTGIKVPLGETFTDSLTGDDWYAIAGGTVSVAVIVIGGDLPA